MNVKIAILIVVAVAISGCQSDPKPERVPTSPPKTPAEFCQQGGKLLGDPYLAEWKKMAVYEKMRNRGCMK